MNRLKKIYVVSLYKIEKYFKNSQLLILKFPRTKKKEAKQIGIKITKNSNLH